MEGQRTLGVWSLIVDAILTTSIIGNGTLPIDATGSIGLPFDTKVLRIKFYKVGRFDAQVLFETTSSELLTLGNDKAVESATRFLTMFENPAKVSGWARTISYVIDSNIGTRTGATEINLIQTRKNQNKVIQSTLTPIAEALTPARVVQYQIIEDATTASFYGVSLSDETETTVLSEELDFELLDECRNPIAIEWLNSLGAFEQYVFELNQDFNDIVEERDIFITPINQDIETAQRVVSKDLASYTQVINMVAQNIARADLQALREIKSSDDVRLWLDKDGSNYINVVVDSALETPYQSDELLHEFSLTIMLPPNFNFFDSKLY